MMRSTTSCSCRWANSCQWRGFLREVGVDEVFRLGASIDETTRFVREYATTAR